MESHENGGLSENEVHPKNSWFMFFFPPVFSCYDWGYITIFRYTQMMNGASQHQCLMIFPHGLCCPAPCAGKLLPSTVPGLCCPAPFAVYWPPVNQRCYGQSRVFRNKFNNAGCAIYYLYIYICLMKGIAYLEWSKIVKVSQELVQHLTRVRR